MVAGESLMLLSMTRMFFASAGFAARVGRHLQCQGWLTRDAQSSDLNLDREDPAR